MKQQQQHKPEKEKKPKLVDLQGLGLLNIIR